MDRPFGKRQHPDQLHFGDIIQQNLLSHSDRCDRGPGAGCDRRRIAGPRCMNHRFFGKPRRYGGDFRSDVRVVADRHVDLRFCDARDAGFCFQSSAVDPIGQQLNFVLRNLIVSRWHGRFIFVSHKCEQVAAASIARFDRRPAAAALHHVSKVR